MKRAKIIVAFGLILFSGTYLVSCGSDVDSYESDSSTEEKLEDEQAEVDESEADEEMDSSRCILKNGGSIGINPTGRTRFRNRGGRR